MNKKLGLLLVALAFTTSATMNALMSKQLFTFFRTAILHNQADSLRLLLKGSGINAINVNVQHWKTGEGPLHWAAERGNVESLRVLLDHGAKIDCKAISHGKTPLHKAALGGHHTCVAVLLDRRAPIEAVDDDGRTALHLAAARGRVDCVLTLCKANANWQAEDNKGRTPGQLALSNGHLALADFLRKPV
ncbi:ankyrin repeat domain-containing protein [bacterium]|nr:MAG: ankyrin repeat domain-containing protein [bacterium]